MKEKMGTLPAVQQLLPSLKEADNVVFSLWKAAVDLSLRYTPSVPEDQGSWDP